MNFRLKIRAELKEGINVSKDLIADEIIGEYVGETIDTSNPEISLTIEDITYEGSGKGKPLHFIVTTEDSEAGSFDREDFEEKLTEVFDGQDQDVEESYYSLGVEDLTRVEELDKVQAEDREALNEQKSSDGPESLKSLFRF